MSEQCYACHLQATHVVSEYDAVDWNHFYTCVDHIQWETYNNHTQRSWTIAEFDKAIEQWSIMEMRNHDIKV